MSVKEHPTRLTQVGRYSDLRMAISLDEEVDNPSDAPTRFQANPYVEATSFKTWEEVSAVTARLYGTENKVATGGTLEAAVAAIAAQTSDPMERTALAVQLVQDKVRYLYNGLGFGNYVPQQPEETWKLRYGDCKAKTLLLLTVLHELDIAADPALVSTTWKDGVSLRLPGFQAFDHIIVRAEVGGEILWLDGTGRGTRLEDLKDVPDHRYALPVKKDGVGLEEIAIRPIGRPFHNVSTQYDMRAGTAFPAVFEMKTVLRTDDATNLKSLRQTLGEEKYREKLDELVEQYAIGAVISKSAFSYDDERSEGTLTARGISYFDWSTRRGKKRHELWNVLDNIELEATRTKSEWKNIPVAISYPSYYRDDAVFLLPGKGVTGEDGFTLAGKTAVAEHVAGFAINRTTNIEGGKLTFNESYYPSSWEIAADQILVEQKHLAAAKKKKASLVAPKTLLENWRQVENAKANGSLDLLKSEFDQIVEHNPEERLVYEQRAYFYQLIGDYKKAAADLDRSIALEKRAAAYSWKADLLVGSQVKEAIKSLNQALVVDPIHSSSVAELADIYMSQNKPEKAQVVIDKARASGLSDERADKLEALVLQATGKEAEADALLSRLIDEDPESLSLLNERCWLRGRSNFKLEEALDDCTEAVELAKKPSSYLDSRALIYYRLGRYDEALADLNLALRLSSNMSSARYLRALVHKAKGDADAAENDYREAIHIYKYVERPYKRFGLVY